MVRRFLPRGEGGGNCLCYLRPTDRSVMSTALPAGTSAVRTAHRFDEAGLERYLTAALHGFRGPLTIRQFESGQSNPTFFLDAGSGTYVLRKKPPGRLLPSAHMVEREHRVMLALRDTDVPVAPMLHLCTDERIIGTPFFVMGYVAGRIFRQPTLPGVAPAERRAIFQSMIDVLARLHRVDHRAIGLADYGKPGNYYARQIARWSEQYVAAQTDDLAAMTALMQWLPAHVPAGDEVSLVHGDYRLENLIFHPTQPTIAAVVDWELSTLGHPLGDLAYNCLLYHLEPDLLGIHGAQPDTDGIPTEAEQVDTYCRLTGRDNIPDWNFYVAFSLFRLASILQGVYARGLQGNASSEQALQRGAAARRVAARGLDVALGR
jgi:aminoglycoside phosphotransferase (APT) family kinase protein